MGWDYKYGRITPDDPMGLLGAHSLIITIWSLSLQINWGTRVHQGQSEEFYNYWEQEDASETCLSPDRENMRS